MWLMEGLKNAVTEYLIKETTSANVFHILDLCVELENQTLDEACFNKVMSLIIF
jgi:hypothetical protein